MEAVDKAVVAAMQRAAPQTPRKNKKGAGKGADGNNQKTWCCHYCNTTNHTEGGGGGDHAQTDKKITLPGSLDGTQNPPSWEGSQNPGRSSENRIFTRPRD